MSLRREDEEEGGALLSRYAARYGDAIRRQQSAVALRAARVEAELAYRARGTFLASMNHELRTPLNAITGFAGLLKEADTYGFGDDQRREYLDHILQSAELLLSHINTILEVADAESGGTKLRKAIFGVSEATDDVARTLTEKLAKKDVALRLDVPGNLPMVHADPEKITTALSHLIEFAAARSRPGMTVTVTVRTGLAGSAANWVYLSVEDDGPGRTSEELAAAMRVFEQVHEGLNRRFASGDLGLPIAKSFIELNGGRFNMKTRPGGGHLFRFALPVAARAAAPEAERAMAS
ncbi:sensor histidine kinase [Parvularcula dongshanensis]|uniref:histidine kinase n=1 Tax=Parvularcula dongshanensis TaxID=1173995 RepID=A0A840I5P6_9PROT|nr:HAMP domain-containing sensor histidine kinase [Parvularcula dongshanensis]MBB4659340.1 signal transduction histidine kinase [Parvularcula dongshanensis]